MGSGMARRLLGAGFPLTVYNRNAELTRPFAADGAQAAATPRHAVAGAQVVISMVADDHASHAVWFGESGALAGLAPGTICVESSTVSVDCVKQLATAVAGAQGELVDAPVTGSKLQAAAGELNFLVGGAEGTFERVRPILSAMGKSVSRVGPAGSGALLKLINNFVCGVQIASAAEALLLIERSGLDRAKALELLANGTPGSPMVKAIFPRMAAANYSPNFMLRLMAKDLTYAIREAEKVSLDLQTGAVALKEFQRGIAAGLGDRDIAAVIEPLRKG